MALCSLEQDGKKVDLLHIKGYVEQKKEETNPNRQRKKVAHRKRNLVCAACAISLANGNRTIGTHARQQQQQQQSRQKDSIGRRTEKWGKKHKTSVNDDAGREDD